MTLPETKSTQEFAWLVLEMDTSPLVERRRFLQAAKASVPKIEIREKLAKIFECNPLEGNEKKADDFGHRDKYSA